jgi:hypothetical protein
MYTGEWDASITWGRAKKKAGNLPFFFFAHASMGGGEVD